MSALRRVSALVLLFAASTVPAGTALTPTVPTAGTQFKETYVSTTPAITTLSAQASACTTPGSGSNPGTNCTIVLADTIVSGWNNVTLYITCSGAATCDDVLVETSLLGTGPWSELVANTFDGMASGAARTYVLPAPYAHLRVEGRAATTSELTIGLVAYRD